MSVSNSVESGRRAAGEGSVIGWGIFGWLLAILAVPIVYLRSPQVPPELLSKQDDDTDISAFELAYVNHLKSRQVKAVWVGVLCAIGTVFLISLSGPDSELSNVSSSGVGSVVKKVVDSQRVVTAEEFARIKDGMSYKEVVSIIGAPGEEMSRVTISDVTTVMYSWTNSDFSNMNAMFQNDKLVSKAQFGL